MKLKGDSKGGEAKMKEKEKDKEKEKEKELLVMESMSVSHTVGDQIGKGDAIAKQHSSPPKSPTLVSKEAQSQKQDVLKTNVSSPKISSTNRNISFRINKIKKETLKENLNESEAFLPDQVGSSPTRVYQPRKKLEKLNYKVGASIIEMYKEKNKIKLQESALTTLEPLISIKFVYIKLF